MTPEMQAALDTHPSIMAAMAEGYSLADCENGRNAAMRGRNAIMAAQRRHGAGSDEAQAAIDEGNRVSRMLTTARAAYNRITHPEWYT